MTVHCPFFILFHFCIKSYLLSKNSLKENGFFSVKFAVFNKYLIMTTSINMKIINFGSYNKFFFFFISHNNPRFLTVKQKQGDSVLFFNHAIVINCFSNTQVYFKFRHSGRFFIFAFPRDVKCMNSLCLGFLISYLSRRLSKQRKQ